VNVTQTSDATSDAPRDHNQHSERFVHPDCRPGHFPQMPPASVFAVEMLFFFAVVAFLAPADSVWGPVIGAVLLVASVVVALRYRVSFRSFLRRPPDDDLRKLYNNRNT
jgi:hypothetical protein